MFDETQCSYFLWFLASNLFFMKHPSILILSSIKIYTTMEYPITPQQMF